MASVLVNQACSPGGAVRCPAAGAVGIVQRGDAGLGNLHDADEGGTAG